MRIGMGRAIVCGVFMGLMAWDVPGAKADVINFTTGGTVYTDSSETTHDPYVHFQGITGVTSDPGQPTFGQLVIDSPASGATKVYDRARFALQIDFTQPGRTSGEFLDILGHLDGTLIGGQPSVLHATIDSIGAAGYADFPPPPTAGALFPYGDLKAFVAKDISVDLSGGRAVITGELRAVPEPTSLLLLAAGFGGVAVARFNRGKRSRFSEPR